MKRGHVVYPRRAVRASRESRRAALQALLAGDGRIIDDPRAALVPSDDHDAILLLTANGPSAFSVEMATCPDVEHLPDDLLSALLTEELRVALEADPIDDLNVVLAFYDDSAQHVPAESDDRRVIVDRLRRLVRSRRFARMPVVYDAHALAPLQLSCVGAVVVSRSSRLAVVRAGTPRDRTLQWLQRTIDDLAFSSTDETRRVLAQLQQTLPECQLAGRWLVLLHGGDTVDVCAGLRVWFRGFDRVFFFASCGEGRLVELDARDELRLA
ncbi:MAG TPA: hypothetical protein VG755_10195 [Nannocystaceae bacterium]|nr:hypothetical protein [Nannocystaceae bacterium]